MLTFINMKLFLLALILPFVLAQDNCPTIQEPVCSENQFACDAGLDANGCPLQKDCIDKDPTRRCSSKLWEMCPTTCPAGEHNCPKGKDDDGCAVLDECMVSDNGDPNCPAQCNDACDLSTQFECPGSPNSEGCQERSTCQGKDPNFPTWQNCPVTCVEGQKWCQGTPGKSYDQCVPEKDGNGCDMPCAVECRDDQKICTFGDDENGCPKEATCIPPGQCCENERECKPAEFDKSSNSPIWKEPVCVPIGQCCENEKQCDQGDSGMSCIPINQCCGNERQCAQGEFDMSSISPIWKDPVCVPMDQCCENEKQCNQGESGMSCVPIDQSCGNEKQCNDGSHVPIDQCCGNEKQCDQGEFGMSCIPYDQCCGNERTCSQGEFDMSTNPPIWKEPECVPMGQCCGNEKQCSQGYIFCVPINQCCGNEKQCNQGEFDMSTNPPIWKDPVCIPKNPCSDPLCPEDTKDNCKSNEVFCPGQTNTETGADGTIQECPTPGVCKPKDFSKCSDTYGEEAIQCTKYCPNGEQLCYSGRKDDDGCDIPPECSKGGVCPDSAA